MTVDVVVPSSGRASLDRLLRRLDGRLRVIVVEDRDGRGPAWARNEGWRQSSADWIAFLDDDVLPDEDWPERLAEDLSTLPERVAGSQGRLRVPLPLDRRPTDWERNVKGLESARWATADMAYRRSVLAAVDGFDERFPRPYREDSDLALRIVRAGYALVHGRRTSAHPVGESGLLDPVRRQAGNADDALMAALHGRDWRRHADEARGRRPWHVATTALGLGALVLRSRVLAIAWAAATGDFAWRRIVPGPRTPDEVARMLVTSVLIPPAAAAWWLYGVARARRLVRRPAAVLLDRDGTLVADVPYNGDPDRVAPMPHAREAVERLRRAGLPTAVVSNQSGVGRGRLSGAQVDAVNRRIEELLGPLGPWFVCTHAPEDACSCRKPQPGLVVAAAAALGVDPADVVVIGDIGADVAAARAAGARAVLVPTAATRPEEVAAAPSVARDLSHAVDLVLGGRV
jgi:histidinol-phosphate phosphatase family protein